MDSTRLIVDAGAVGDAFFFRFSAWDPAQASILPTFKV